MDMTADHKSLIVSNAKSEISLFNYELGEELNTYKGHIVQKYPIKCRISKDNSFFATGSEDGQCYLYNFLEKKHTSTLYGHTDVVSCVDINRKTGHAATGSFDCTVKYWCSI